MANYSALLQTFKQIAYETINASNPVNVCLGKVTSVAPLKILVEQKLTLTSAQLILTRNVTDYEADVTVDLSEEVTGIKKIIFHNALKNGDEVVLLRVQGGQKYVVMDKVVN